MSLNYELTAIENWQELKEQPGTVQVMCFLSMFIGMPLIEADGKDSWREFFQRARMWETAFGPIGSHGDTGEPTMVTPELCERFIGLRTNSSRMTNTLFAKRLAESMRADAKRTLDRWPGSTGEDIAKAMADPTTKATPSA